MADNHARVLASLLLGLISCLISCLQINVALLNSKMSHFSSQLNISRLLVLNSLKSTLWRLERDSEQQRRGRYWMRPGRTSAWWHSFTAQLVWSVFTHHSNKQTKPNEDVYVLFLAMKCVSNNWINLTWTAHCIGSFEVIHITCNVKSYLTDLKKKKSGRCLVEAHFPPKKSF